MTCDEESSQETTTGYLKQSLGGKGLDECVGLIKDARQALFAVVLMVLGQCPWMAIKDKD